jgi:hypothetical protein
LKEFCEKDSQIRKARGELDKRWQAFCERIIEVYGSHVVLVKSGDGDDETL